MNFEQLLRGYIGRSVEIFLENNFYTGELVSVGTGLFTVQTSDSTYMTPETQVTLNLAQVGFVRILAES